jgi:hypothetical protein
LTTFGELAPCSCSRKAPHRTEPHRTEPREFDRIEAEPLDSAGVPALIDGMLSSGRVLGQRHDEALRISIADAQEKTARLLHDGQWMRPLTPAAPGSRGWRKKTSARPWASPVP